MSFTKMITTVSNLKVRCQANNCGSSKHRQFRIRSKFHFVTPIQFNIFQLITLRKRDTGQLHTKD